MSQPTMADVAKQAGVSKNTVSLALRDSPRVAEETRQRVIETAKFMGYRLNPTVAHLMAQLRQSQSPGFRATLAIINTDETSDAFTAHPAIHGYVRGCRRRALQLGYELDEFWMHEPEMPLARWQAVFRARNIRGAVLVGMMRQNRMLPQFSPLWDEFPAVVTGLRTRDPALSFASSDHYALALEAFEKAMRLGYRRPALVLDGAMDKLADGRFTAGFLTGQSHMVHAGQRTRPFYQIASSRQNRVVFYKWLDESQPDVIFTLHHQVRDWLLDAGRRVPENMGLIHYDWRADHGDWAGMNQRNDLVGEVAMDMLVSMVHHNERGVPENPRATMIASRWVDGATVRPQSH